MNLFFAAEVFPISEIPLRVVPVVNCLQNGEHETGEQLLELLGEDAVGQALYAQLLAAFSVLRGDFQSAANIILLIDQTDLSIDVQAKIAFSLGACAQEAGGNEGALAHFETAVSLLPTVPLFVVECAYLIWSLRGVVPGRRFFREHSSCLASPLLWAAWARLERKAGYNEQALDVIQEGRIYFPNDPDLINIQATCYLHQKSYKQAISVLSHIGDEMANHPIVCCNRASALFALMRYADSAAEFKKALDASPEMFDACFGLGRSLFFLERLDEAEGYLDQALKLRPHHEEVISLLSQLYFKTKRETEAIQLFEVSLPHMEDPYGLRYMHAVACFWAGEHDLAEESALVALNLRPEAEELNDLCGLLFLQSCNYQKAMSYFAKAVNAKKARANEFYSNWLYACSYSSLYSAKEVFQAHLSYGQRFNGLEEDQERPFKNSREVKRKLRIGYVSPDFRAHSVAFFLVSIIEGHHREDFEVFAYSNTLKHDTMTDRFREIADVWRDVRGRDVEEVLEIIRNDQIDILVDLAGHTADNLLPVFARRAAPVQVNYLGYPNTTGVMEMDYRLVDVVTDPPGEADELATETLYRLPDSFLCYRILDDLSPIDLGPVSRGKPMTFGSFNNLNKLDVKVFDAWAKILQQVPDAQLMLKSKQLSNEAGRRWVCEEFASRGISEERLRLVTYTKTLGEHLALYSEIDLALDTFPYNGTTTTCEAISMGVPVLTIVGDRHCARVGESLIRTLGLERGFLAQDQEDYVQRAVAFAEFRLELAEMRVRLRDIVSASRLCDVSSFIANLEAAYRQMWREWATGEDRQYSRTPSQFELDLTGKCAKS